MEHLGRTKGNPLLVICQKWLTGHPKGAAAAWMLNGLIQSMNTGRVPGNRNADNISEELEAFDHLVYPNTATELDKIPAALLKSFGFGQAGAEILLVHPDRLAATLTAAQFNSYREKFAARRKRCLRSLHRTLAGKQNLVQVKSAAPYTAGMQNAVYLNPQARARYSANKATWEFEESGTPIASAAAAAEAGDTRKINYDRREAEALLAAMRRGRRFGHIRDSVETLEERQRAVAERRPGEFVEDEDATETESPESQGIFRRQRSPSPRPTRSALQQAAESATAQSVLHASPGEHGIGIDVEALATFQTASSHFLDRNFTSQEQVRQRWLWFGEERDMGKVRP